MAVHNFSVLEDCPPLDYDEEVAKSAVDKDVMLLETTEPSNLVSSSAGTTTSAPVHQILPVCLLLTTMLGRLIRRTTFTL